MDYTTFQAAADQFTSKLESFLAQKGLSDWFVGPVDHFAIKTADSTEYQGLLKKFRAEATDGSEAFLNNCHLATIVLPEAIAFGPLGSTDVLELMEPRPEKVGHDFVGLEHIELVVDSIEPIKERLEQKQIDFEICQNPHHEAVAFKITDNGLEVKFTTSRLLDIQKQELADGSATPLT